MGEYAILWHDEKDKEACIIDYFPKNLEMFHRPRTGKRMGKLYYPKPIDFLMSKDIGGRKTGDLITNAIGYLIVSEKLKKVFMELKKPKIEFLPMYIKSEKGRVDEQFYVVNLLNCQVFCADLEKSEMRESALRKGRYSSIRKLVLDESKIDKTLPIFRLGEMPKLLIVRKDFAKKLKEFKGVSFLQLGKKVWIF